MILAGDWKLLRGECGLDRSMTAAGGGASVPCWTMGSGLVPRRDLEGPVGSGPRTSMIGIEPCILEPGGAGTIWGDYGSPKRVG
jgi:hypothetical protein